MKKVYCLFIAINLATLVRSKDDVWFGSVFTSVMNRFTIDSKAVESSNLQCSLDIDVYKNYLANGTFWAAQMDDASAKSVGGIFEGDTYHPGHPSQCINTRAPPLNISGKYCLAEAVIRPSYVIDPEFDTGDFARDFPPYDMMLSYWEGLRHKVDILWHDRNTIKWGVCIPDSCTSEDLYVSLKLALEAACAQNNISVDIRLSESDCYTKHEVYSRPMSTGARVWLYVLYVIVALIFVGTTYDCCLRHDKISEKKRMPKLESLVLPFSLASNITRIVSVPEDNRLSILFGIKAVSMAILVFGHLGMARFGNRMINMAYLEEAFRDVALFITLNGTIVVDTFFLVSGFLTARQLTEHLEKRGSVNLLLVYLDRIMRVLPTYVTVITFYMYILPLLGQGPRWNEISGRESSRCLQNWWTNLLYVNNFVNPEKMCLLQSWYLTADLQMFIFTTPVIYFLFKYPRWKKPVLWGLLTASVIVPTLIVYYNNIWGTFPMITDWFYDPPSVPYYINFYIQSYVRYIPYMIGVCSHFVCVQLIDRKITFTTTHKFIIFFSGFFAIMGTFIYVSLRFYVNPYQFQLTEQVIYAGLHRIIWSVSWAFIIVVHQISGFGVFSDIMCARMFIFLSRLSLSILLTHIGIILYTVSSDEQNFFVSVHKFFILYMGSYLFSILTAFLLTMSVEMPMEIFWKRLKKMIMEPTSKRKNGEVASKTNNTVIQVPEVNLEVEEKKVIGDRVQYTMRL